MSKIPEREGSVEHKASRPTFITETTEGLEQIFPLTYEAFKSNLAEESDLAQRLKEEPALENKIKARYSELEDFLSVEGQKKFGKELLEVVTQVKDENFERLFASSSTPEQNWKNLTAAIFGPLGPVARAKIEKIVEWMGLKKEIDLAEEMNSLIEELEKEDPGVVANIYDILEYYMVGWITPSMRISNAEIAKLKPEERMYTGQINNRDRTDRGAMQFLMQKEIEKMVSANPDLVEPARVFELGTGSGDIARLARAFPHAEIHTLTISSEQAKNAAQVFARMGIENITVYTGDIFDPKVQEELGGEKYDYVTTKEVLGHAGSEERKILMLQILHGLLTPDGGGIFSITNTPTPDPEEMSWRRKLAGKLVGPDLEHFFKLMVGWEFTERGWEEKQATEGMIGISSIDSTKESRGAFIDSVMIMYQKEYQEKLEQRLDKQGAILWPLMFAVFGIATKYSEYLHITAVKPGSQVHKQLVQRGKV